MLLGYGRMKMHYYCLSDDARYGIIFCAKICIVCEKKEDEGTEVASGQSSGEQ